MFFYYFFAFNFLYSNSVKIFSIWIANDYRPSRYCFWNTTRIFGLAFGLVFLFFFFFFFLSSFNWQLLSDKYVKNNIKSSIFRMEGEHAWCFVCMCAHVCVCECMFSCEPWNFRGAVRLIRFKQQIGNVAANKFALWLAWSPIHLDSTAIHAHVCHSKDRQ